MAIATRDAVISPSRLPTVSIIMPAYNAALHIDEAIASALGQTCADLELIVVDDGSTDGTLARLRRWADRDDRVVVLRQSNLGVSAARNAALALSRGRFLALLDSDDVWDATFLAAHLALFARMPQAGVITSNAWQLGGSRHGEPLWPRRSGPRVMSFKDLLEDETAVCIMSVFRREVYETIGGFDVTLRNGEDYQFWLRAAHAGFTFVQSPTPLARYRRRPDGASADTVAMLDGIRVVLSDARERWCVDRGEEAAIVGRQLRRFERERLLVEGKRALLSGRFGAASEAFTAASRLGRSAKLQSVAVLCRWSPRLLRRLYILRTPADGRPACSVKVGS